MNKPDSYMPMYWPDFWTAVRGWPDIAILGYLKALSYYWHHDHCNGLRDNPESLRLICERDKSDWVDCMGLIFDNKDFFTLEYDSGSGLWHQKRARDEWKKWNNNYQSAVSRAKLGAEARWAGHTPKKVKNA